MNQTTATANLPTQSGITTYHHEKMLFGILATVSIAFWLLLTIGTIGIVWIYMLSIYVFVLFAQSALISFLKGNAVRLDADQFPDLHARLAACCQRLGIATVPESYLMTGDGMLNAFATRFLRRYYVVLLSDVVDALEEDPEAINFYIGHELGHIDRKHIANGWWMGPALMMPLLGAAYRRAQEYTCDQYGLACCANQQSATRALAVLAAGTRRWQTLNTDAYVAQCAQSGGFWMSLNELASDYPWLCKRMARLHNPGQRLPSRHPFAWFLAIFMPRVGPGGPLVSLMMLFAMVGILAAIAIPSYVDYQARAKAAPAFAYGGEATAAVAAWFEEHEAVPDDLNGLGLTRTLPAGTTAALDSENGIVTLSIGRDDNITYVPSLNEENHIEWSCSTTLPAKAIPPGSDCESMAPAGLGGLLGSMGQLGH